MFWVANLFLKIQILREQVSFVNFQKSMDVVASRVCVLYGFLCPLWRLACLLFLTHLQPENAWIARWGQHSNWILLSGSRASETPAIKDHAMFNTPVFSLELGLSMNLYCKPYHKHPDVLSVLFPGQFRWARDTCSTMPSREEHVTVIVLLFQIWDAAGRYFR